MVRAHVSSHANTTYSIAKFPAVRCRALTCVLVAPFLPQALSYATPQLQGPPGFKSKKEAAWQLTREANTAADAPKGADGCAAPVPRSATALLQLAYLVHLRIRCPSSSKVLSQLKLNTVLPARRCRHGGHA